MGIYCEITTTEFSHGNSSYGCLIENTQTPETKRITLSGVHEYGKADNDVTDVSFSDCVITKIPQDLSLMFPNLKYLFICNSKLKKISKNDLIEYRNLELISMMENELEYLSGDLFDGFTRLNYINFQKNKLIFIEPNILDGLGEIKRVDFSNNINYKKHFSVYPVYEPNATLDEVKTELYEKFYSRFKFLKEQRITEVNLKNQIEELKNSETVLKEENRLLKIHHEQPPENPANLSADFKKYIQDDNLKDFKITIDDREFLVHKFLLIVRSPTLAEILQNNPEVETLNLVDIPVEIFEKILNFFYTDEHPDKADTNFMHLFAAAGKLKIQKLSDFAAEVLQNQIDSENALEILHLSQKYDSKELKIRAFAEITKKYPKIDFKNEWIENAEKLQNIIEMLRKQEEAKREFENQFKKMLEMD
jgi:Leucine-rich repeat (LRR) protein